MEKDAIKEARTRYCKAHEVVEDILVQALCDTYKAVTADEASDRLRDAFYDAIRVQL